jgi:hypothetical protein
MRRNPTRPLNVLASAAAVADAEMAAATAGRPVSHLLIFPHHGTFAEDPVILLRDYLNPLQHNPFRKSGRHHRLRGASACRP